MRRNKYFHPSREPLKTDRSLHLVYTSGPFSLFNPTRAYYKHSLTRETQAQDSACEALQGSDRQRIPSGDDAQYASSIGFEWRSRNNRKGRHALIISPTPQSSALYLTPNSSSNYHETVEGIVRMSTQFPYWDVSYLVAITFTCGSIIWVLNAFFVYLPLAQPLTEFKNEILIAGGVTAFLGASVFEIGSILLMLEAVNENRAGCFGWALARVIEGYGNHNEKYRVEADVDICLHHHTNKNFLIGEPASMVLAFHPSSKF